MEIITAQEASEILRMPPSWVYRNKNALGAFQAKPGGRLLFDKQTIREKFNAVSNEKRQMACAPDDRRETKNKNLSNQKGGQSLGSKSKPRNVGGRDDPHGIFG
jgi:hypothetical protein